MTQLFADPNWRNMDWGFEGDVKFDFIMLRTFKIVSEPWILSIPSIRGQKLFQSHLRSSAGTLFHRGRIRFTCSLKSPTVMVRPKPAPAGSTGAAVPPSWICNR